MTSLFRSALVLAGLLAATGLQAQQMLPPGQTLQFELAGNTVTNDIAIDVPANARQLRLRLTAGGNADTALLVRYGEAFPLQSNAGNFGGVDWLHEHAHYASIGRNVGGEGQFISITRRQHQPLREGRWHLAVLNYGGGATQMQLQAEVSTEQPAPTPISVVFDDSAACNSEVSGATASPWSDGTTATPTDGNTGTTLGQQRRNAFNRALDLVAEQIRGVGPIRILACWNALGGEETRATLASARPYLIRDDLSYHSPFGALRSLEKTYTWYATPAAAQQAGTDYCRYSGDSCTAGINDIYIQFNSDIDNGNALGSRRFGYGFGSPGGGNVDFIATAMHEILHGLGFIGLLAVDPDAGTPVGEKFRGRLSSGSLEPYGHNDVYSDAVVHVAGDTVRELNRLPRTERASALTSGQNLRWADPGAVNSFQNPFAGASFPGNLPRLFAPAELQPGSSFSHLDNSHPRQLMLPSVTPAIRDTGLGAPMLSALGWRQNDVPAPVHARPYGGNWFDPARNGHGIDLHRVSGTEDTYFLVFYTFDETGRPEWLFAIGRIVDGVFIPGDNQRGDSLWRVTATPGVTPLQTQIDTSVRGQVRIDFNQADQAPECNDGTGRNQPLALMSFRYGSTTTGNEIPFRRWCLTQIVAEDDRPAVDRTGHWFAGDSDSGWGLTVLNWGDEGEGLFAVLYYFDALGQPRWAASQDLHYQSGDEMDMMQVQGYCRDCPAPQGNNPASPIGTLRLTLDPPEGSNGQASFNVSFDGPGGGSFQRTATPLERMAESAPVDD